MVPDLTERDRERFAALRSRLDGVSRAEPTARDDRPVPGPIDPMLATSFKGDLGDVDEDEFLAERKFDGTRLLLEKFDGEVSLYTRRHVERSGTLTNLTSAANPLPDGLILDGEYTYLTPAGVSQFEPIHSGAEKLTAKSLTGRFFAFDVLAVDGEWCTRRPLLERRSILRSVVPTDDVMSVTEARTGDFQAYYDDLVAAGEEGIMLKRRDSPYHLGTRSTHWQKVKAFTEADVLAVGYTPGEGRRRGTFGALVMTDGESYVGRVGSGFTEAELVDLLGEMTPVPERPVPEEAVGMPYTPVEPFVIEVKYQAVTESGELRAPVFHRRRPDTPVGDVTPITGG